MKKLFLLTFLVLGAFAAQAAGTAALKLTDDMDIAFDGDKMYGCLYEVEGQDVHYTIYNNFLEVVKTFTIKGVVIPQVSGEEQKTYFEPGDLYISTVDTEDVVASKGLFTDDGKWCVIFEEGKGYNPEHTYVYNEDGVRLFELPRTTENWSGSDRSYTGQIFLGEITTGKPYYVTEDRSNNGYEVTFWSFVTAGVNAPVAIRTVPVYPNPLPQGAVLTVELPEAADAHTMFVVNDMNGRQVFRREVRQGDTEMKVSPRFGRGAYVYTVIYSDGTTYSGKLAAE